MYHVKIMYVYIHSRYFIRNFFIFFEHSISSNRDSLIGTPLVSIEKYRDNSVFGGKNRGQAMNKTSVRRESKGHKD